MPRSQVALELPCGHYVEQDGAICGRAEYINTRDGYIRVVHLAACVVGNSRLFGEWYEIPSSHRSIYRVTCLGPWLAGLQPPVCFVGIAEFHPSFEHLDKLRGCDILRPGWLCCLVCAARGL